MELIVWLGIWLSNDYLALLLTIILVAIVLAVLIIALISEALERSRVSRRYFQIMALSAVAPVVAAALYIYIFGGSLDFLEKI